MKLIIICLLLIIVNMLFTRIQLAEIQKIYTSLRKNYPTAYISVGKDKKILKKGSLAIVVADKQGFIREIKLLKGYTIFSKFKNIMDYNSYNVYETFELTDEPAIIHALTFITDKLKEESIGHKDNE